MPQPPIAIYGAIARFNYGDLLFPLVLQRALESADCDRPIVAVGLRESNLSPFGALPTRPVHWLSEPSNLPDGSKVIVAGGEVLAAGWGRLYSHLLPQRFGDSIYSLMSRCLSERTLDRLGQHQAGVPWPIPLCPSKRDFANDVDLIFNAVGGSGLEGQPEHWCRQVRNTLSSASFASVRDQVTFDAVGGSGSGVELHPDSAAVMANMFPRSWLRGRCRPDVRAIIDGDRPFLCFQLHRYFAPSKLRSFARELDRVRDRHRMRVVLLPIGRAAGHSDQIALKKIRGAMSTVAELPEDLGVFDIMALLAHASAYAGTSLHGLITAMSYGRPYAVLGKNPKCIAFANSWSPQQFRAPLEAKGFCEDIGERIGLDRSVLTENALHLRAAARDGLDRVVAAALDLPIDLERPRARRTAVRDGAESRSASSVSLAG